MPVSIPISTATMSPTLTITVLRQTASMHNVRVFNNRCFNVAVGGMSPQPVFGGPVYFIRNVVYHSPYGPVKNSGSCRQYCITTTPISGSLADYSRIQPALSQQPDFWPGKTARNTGHSHLCNYSSSDYNGFRVNPTIPKMPLAGIHRGKFL